MSIEYDLVLGVDSDVDTVLTQISNDLGAEKVDDGYARADGVELSGRTNSAEDVRDLDGPLLGERDLVSITFRMDADVVEAVAQRCFHQMIGAALEQFTVNDAVGLLKFNGEYIILQRLPGEAVVFGHDWRDYSPIEAEPGLDGLSAGYPTAQLPQPLM